MDRKDIDPVLGIFLSALPIAAADQGSATIGLRVNRTLAAELKTVRLQNVFTVRHTTQGCTGGERLTSGQGGGWPACKVARRSSSEPVRFSARTAIAA